MNNDLKIHFEEKWTRIAKTVLKKDRGEETCIPDIKSHRKVLCCWRDIKID